MSEPIYRYWTSPNAEAALQPQKVTLTRGEAVRVNFARKSTSSRVISGATITVRIAASRTAATAIGPLACTVSGSDFYVDLSAANTEALEAGDWWFSAFDETGDELLSFGPLIVWENPELAPPDSTPLATRTANTVYAGPASGAAAAPAFRALVAADIPGTTVGLAVLASTNPSAITFLRANANNTVSWLSASDFRTAIGAGTGDLTKSGAFADNRILRADGTAGAVQASGVTIDDSGTITGPASIYIINAAGEFQGQGFDAEAGTIATTGAVVGGTFNGNTITTGTGTLTLSTFTLTATATGNVVVADGSGNVTISGNLTVSGDTFTANTASYTVEDPLIQLGSGNAGDAVDEGWVASYTASGVKYRGVFWDASASVFRVFTGLEEAPTTTVNIAGTGYTVGTMVVNITGNASGSSGSCTGNAATATNVAASGVTGTTLAANVVSSSLTGVGTLTSGGTGAGFTIGLGTSTVTGSLPLANGATVVVVGTSAFTLADAYADIVIDGASATLSVALAASTTYEYEAEIPYTCVADKGIGLRFSASGGLTATAFRSTFANLNSFFEQTYNATALVRETATTSTTLTSNSYTDAGLSTSYTSATVQIRGFITTGVAGTLTIQAKRGVAGQAGTVAVGSTFKITKKT